MVLWLLACITPERIVPSPSPPSTASRAEIERWIAELPALSAPGIGYSPSMTGAQFLPLAGSDEAGMLLLGQPPPQRSDLLREIVGAGVRAVPVLLGCLADKTPTALPPMSAMMWTARADEYDFNARTTATPSFAVNREGDIEAPAEYTVTVGDLCFVALGQIVNRSFSAVRYQPTGGLIISSPSESEALRQAVQAEWGQLTESSHRERLIRDLEQPDHERRRTGAVERMGFYYPDALPALMQKLLAEPAYDPFATQDFTRALYPMSEAQRKRAFDDFVETHGEAGRDGLLQDLYDDLDTQEAYEQKRISPPTAGSDYRARECLMSLYSLTEPVDSRTRPHPRFMNTAQRERLLEAAARVGCCR